MIKSWGFLLLLLPAIQSSYAQKQDALTGAVVRSREYIVHRSPHKVEEFIGSVYYRGGGREMHSDWARFDHKSQIWKARGHVQGSLKMKDGGTVEAWGEEAEHNSATSKGWLAEKDPSHPIRFTHEQGGLQDQGVAHRLEWNQSESRAWGRGDVHVWGDHGEAWAGTTEFHDPEKLLTLTERRPVVVHQEPTWNGAIQAERIRAYEDQHRLLADDHVQGWILFHNTHPDKAKK